MSEPNERIKRVLNELEALQFFGPLSRFPPMFYRLSQEDQAETVKIYKQRMANRTGRPYKETK